MNNLKVTCYSGHTYAERPDSFEWQGVKYKIEEMLKAWQEPGKRCFRVKTGNKVFELCYNEAHGQWSGVEILGFPPYRARKETGSAKGNTQNSGK